jgi:hypothetical protein
MTAPWIGSPAPAVDAGAAVSCAQEECAANTMSVAEIAINFRFN